MTQVEITLTPLEFAPISYMFYDTQTLMDAMLHGLGDAERAKHAKHWFSAIEKLLSFQPTDSVTIDLSDPPMRRVVAHCVANTTALLDAEGGLDTGDISPEEFKTFKAAVTRLEKKTGVAVVSRR